MWWYFQVQPRGGSGERGRLAQVFWQSSLLAPTSALVMWNCQPNTSFSFQQNILLSWSFCSLYERKRKSQRLYIQRCWNKMMTLFSCQKDFQLLLWGVISKKWELQSLPILSQGICIPASQIQSWAKNYDRFPAGRDRMLNCDLGPSLKKKTWHISLRQHIKEFNFPCVL